MSLSATSPWFMNPSRDGEPTTSLGSCASASLLFQMCECRALRRKGCLGEEVEGWRRSFCCAFSEAEPGTVPLVQSGFQKSSPAGQLLSGSGRQELGWWLGWLCPWSLMLFAELCHSGKVTVILQEGKERGRSWCCSVVSVGNGSYPFHSAKCELP